MKRLHAFTLAEGATHVDISGNIRRVAFTLAEVLITLAIIGVVAALTIPTLVTNYQKKAYVTAMQKTYSLLLNGFQLMTASENVEYLSDTQFINDLKSQSDSSNTISPEFVIQSVNKNLSKYFKIANTCYGENQSDCPLYGINYKYLNGTQEEESFIIGTPYFQLQDGTVIWISEVSAPTNEPTVMLTMIDINGEKGPNIVGRDLILYFVLLDAKKGNNQPISKGHIQLVSYGKYAAMTGAFEYDKYSDYGEETCKNACGVIGSSDISKAMGMDCFDRIVEEGWKMNY